MISFKYIPPPPLDPQFDLPFYLIYIELVYYPDKKVGKKLIVPNEPTFPRKCLVCGNSNPSELDIVVGPTIGSKLKSEVDQWEYQWKLELCICKNKQHKGPYTPNFNQFSEMFNKVISSKITDIRIVNVLKRFTDGIAINIISIPQEDPKERRFRFHYNMLFTNPHICTEVYNRLKENTTYEKVKMMEFKLSDYLQNFTIELDPYDVAIRAAKMGAKKALEQNQAAEQTPEEKYQQWYQKAMAAMNERKWPSAIVIWRICVKIATESNWPERKNESEQNLNYCTQQKDGIDDLLQ